MARGTSKGSEKLRILNFKHGTLNGSLGSRYQYRVNEYEATEQGFAKTAAAETFKTDILEGMGPLIGTVLKDVTAEGASEASGMENQPVKHQRLRIRIPEIHSHLIEPSTPDDDFFINQHGPVFVAANNVPRAQVNDIVLVQLRSSQNLEGGVYIQNYTRTGDNDPNADAFSRTLEGAADPKEWCRKKPAKKLNMDLAKTLPAAKGMLRPASNASNSCLIIGDSTIQGSLGDVLQSYMGYQGWNVIKYGSKQFDFYGIKKPVSTVRYKPDFEVFLQRLQKAVATRPAARLVFISVGVLFNAGEEKSEKEKAATTTGTPASTPAGTETPAASGTGGGGTAAAAQKKPTTAPGGREAAAIEEDFKRIISAVRSRNPDATLVWIGPPALVGHKEFTVENIKAGKASIVKNIVDKYKSVLKPDGTKTFFIDGVNNWQTYFPSYDGLIKRPKGSNGVDMSRAAAKDFVVAMINELGAGSVVTSPAVQKTSGTTPPADTDPVTPSDIQEKFEKARTESENEATRREGIVKLYSIVSKNSKKSIGKDSLELIKNALVAWASPAQKDKSLYEKYIKYRFDEREEIKDLVKTKLGVDINVYKDRVFHLECKTVNRKRETAHVTNAATLTKVETNMKNIFGADLRTAGSRKEAFERIQEEMIAAGIQSGPTNFFLKDGKKISTGLTIYHWPFPFQRVDKEGKVKKVFRQKKYGFKGAVLHNDLTPSAKSCWNVLYAKGISVHFIVTHTGRIYQCVDLNAVSFHGTIANGTHVGIEIQNSLKYGKSYMATSKKTGKPVKRTHITGILGNPEGEKRRKRQNRPLFHFQDLNSGRETKKMIDGKRGYALGPPKAQVNATHNLLNALAKILASDGFQYTLEGSGRRIKKVVNGVMAHYQYAAKADGSTMMELLRQKKKQVAGTPHEVVTAIEARQAFYKRKGTNPLDEFIKTGQFN